ncbi:MAG: hypothetical protein M3281_00750 [Chloroflexota bacterium]|nr:hypothetical protein [Chloroflexota bacterium]
MARKSLTSIVMALTLILLLALPVFAGDDQQGGAGDDQQGGTGNDQQGGGQQMVTKTFKLTINGTVPSDRAFAAFYGTRDQFEASENSEDPAFSYILFCGQPEDAEFANTVISDADCVGNGHTYSASVELPQGTALYFAYATAVETDLDNTADFYFGNATSFFQGKGITGEAEVLNTDFTNTSWFTFGSGAGYEQQGDNQQTGGDQQGGAGNDQQGDNQQAGAVDDQQADNQQAGGGDDQQSDNQQGGAGDDQQAEMPTNLPKTGAGGMAGGLPLGQLAAAGWVLAGALALARRR